MSGKTKDAANTSKEIKVIGEKEIKAQIEQIADQVNVPKVIMKRVNALKNLQVKLIDIESKFYEELHLLECKYSSLYEPLYEKRRSIINGEYEPNEEETQWKYDDDDQEEGDGKQKKGENEGEKKGEESSLGGDLKAKLKLVDDEAQGGENIKGVPDFWLQTFKSVELIAEMIQEYDEPILKHLVDLRVNLHDKRPYGYTLEFHFGDNEYFSNKVLTKTYELRTEADETDPFSYEGPDIIKSKGCAIEWKKGKNVCVRVIKKKQKHKSTGTIRVITKEIKQDSFFNYFDAVDEHSQALEKKDDHHSKSDNEENLNDKNDESLEAADFEIGHLFKERIIPKAILYFTGEIVDEDDMYDDYDDEDDEDDDDDDGNKENFNDGDDDDDDEDEDDDAAEDDKKPLHHHHSRNKHGGHHGHKGCKSPKQHGDDEKSNPPECKNQ